MYTAADVGRQCDYQASLISFIVNQSIQFRVCLGPSKIHQTTVSHLFVSPHISNRHLHASAVKRWQMDSSRIALLLSLRLGGEIMSDSVWTGQKGL